MNSVINCACSHTPDFPIQSTYVFLDKFDIVLKFKIDKTFRNNEPIRETLPKKLQIFSRNEFVVYKYGICELQRANRKTKYSSTTGKRILSLIRNIPYKNKDNKYTHDDIEFCSKNLPDSKVYKFQLDFIKATIEDIRSYLEKRFEAKVSIQTFVITCIEFCHDSPLSPDPKEYKERIYKGVCRKFGFIKEKTKYGRKNAESIPRWLVRSDNGLLWVKSYDNGETDRLEFRYEMPKIDSYDFNNAFSQLVTLGNTSLINLHALITESTRFQSRVSIAKLRKKLIKEACFKPLDFKSDWMRKFIFEVSTSGTYTPSKYEKDETAPKSKQERLSHPQCGILEKHRVYSEAGVKTLHIVYHLKSKWFDVDMTAYRSRGANRTTLTPEALEKLLKERETKVIQKLIWSNSLWQQSDENDELIQLLKSKSA